MKDSFARRLMIQGELDDLTSTVDRLSIDQQAFMSTGDDRFQDGVYASIVTLDRRLAGLNASMAGNAVQRARLVRLSAAIKQVVDAVAQSYEVKDARGAAAALAFLDTNDAAISAAKSRAAELSSEMARDLSNQIIARGSNGLMTAILYGTPAGVTFGRGVTARRALRMAR
jgi:CHASE3 domain sensor protein